EFDFELLRRGAGLDERAAAEGLEELIRRRVVHAVGNRFDFVHEQIREFAVADMLPPRRRLLHAEVAAAMEGLVGEDVLRHSAALGTHYREAGIWDRAVVFLRRAGRQATERCAYREAVVLLEQAREALACLPDSRTTLEHAFDMRLEL